MPANGYRAAFYIPEARNELRDRGFAAAGGTDERGHAVLRHVEADSVEYLRVVMIAEGHVLDLDAVIGKDHGGVAVHLLLRLEYLVHLPDGRADERERVHKVERCHNGCGHTEREDDDGDERLDGERAVRIEQPPNGSTVSICAGKKA